MVKNTPAAAGDSGFNSCVERSPGGRNGNLLQYSCLGNPMGRGAFAGYSPWGRKESDTAEPLSTHMYVLTLDTNWQAMYQHV